MSRCFAVSHESHRVSLSLSLSVSLSVSPSLALCLGVQAWKRRQLIHSEFRERLLEAQEKERDELLRRHGQMREDKLRELNAFRGVDDDGDDDDDSGEEREEEGEGEDSGDLRSD